MTATAALCEILLKHLRENDFRSGPSSDTPTSGYALSESEKAMLLAYQELLHTGQVTETKTHFRAGGIYSSYYRLKKEPRP